MSGFFALRADTFQRAQTLNPIGYKLALELLCKCRVRRVREVPIHFGLRQTGQSKLTFRQQLRFLDHLSRLYDFCYPRRWRWLNFFITNACGWLIAFGLYVRLVSHDVSALLAPTVAFAAVVAVTAIFHMRAQRIHSKGSHSWIKFASLAIAQWAACALSARWVALHAVDMSAAHVFLLAFGTAAVVGVVVRKRTSRSGSTSASADIVSTRETEKPHLRQAA
jgi:dolichol-phosphate mannosyltransferase